MNRRDFLKLSTMAAATPIVSAFGASNNDASSPKSTSGSALFRVKPYVQLFDEDSVCITSRSSALMV